MPNDINTRIAIVVESSAARQAIREVTDELERLVIAREKYLQLVKEGEKREQIGSPNGAGNIQDGAAQYDHLADAIDSLSAKFANLDAHILNIISRISENNAEVNKLRDSVGVMPSAINSMSEALAKIGNVNFSNAEKELSKISRSVSDITDQKERDLRISLAKSRMEQAEYQSEIAAQKAYNAELQLETAEKLKQQRIKRGADAEEIQKRTERIQQFRGEVLKLQQAEAAANLQAYKSKKAYENLLTPLDEVTESTDEAAESTDEATEGTQKLTFAQVAARMVGRALGIELSGTSQAMLALGIAGAAGAAAVKLVKFAYDQWRESLADAADLEQRNSESLLEATDRLSERIEKEKEALETVEELGNKQNRTVDETVKLSRAIRLLGGDFAELAKSADLANGGVADFSSISEAAAKKQYAAKLRQLQAAYNQLSAAEEAQVTRRDTAGVPVWFGGDWRIGGGDEAKEAQEKINELAEKRLEIQREINELKQSEIERLQDQEVAEKAIVVVSNKNIDRQLDDLKKQREIQDLINSGREREAEILKIRNQLDKEALSLKGKELEIFKSRRAEIESSMLASYDQKAAEIAKKAAERAEKERLQAAERAEKERLQAAERAEKERLQAAERAEKERLQAAERAESFSRKIDTQLDDLKKQRKIQDLINSGREREAEILKIRNQLDKEALSLKGKELEIFNSRRAEIESSMLASYDQKAAEIAKKAAERAEKERLQAAERAEKERLQAAERGMKAEENAYKSLYDKIFSYRETVQKAITSNSAEGIALQSRILVNSSVSTEQNSAKETAANTKQMVQRLLALQTEIHQLRTAMTANGIKVSGITGHRY